jgi:hypothetical protein
MQTVKKIKLSTLAAEHGVENLRVFFPARRREGFFGLVVVDESNPAIVQEGRIVEDERANRQVEHDYRVIMEPLDKDFAHEDFYTHDFESNSQRMPDHYYVMVGDVKYVLGFQKTPVAA